MWLFSKRKGGRVAFLGLLLVLAVGCRAVYALDADAPKARRGHIGSFTTGAPGYVLVGDDDGAGATGPSDCKGGGGSILCGFEEVPLATLLADKVGTPELFDLADTPAAGECVLVATDTCSGGACVGSGVACAVNTDCVQVLEYATCPGGTPAAESIGTPELLTGSDPPVANECVIVAPDQCVASACVISGVSCATNGDCVQALQFAACPGGGGSSLVLDLGDDGADESTDLAEIASANDPDAVLSEPAPDKLLLDLLGIRRVVESMDCSALVTCGAGDRGLICVDTDDDKLWFCDSSGPAWVTPGDILKVGTCTSGSCFANNDTSDHTLVHEGVTADTLEIEFGFPTTCDPVADARIDVPCDTADSVLLSNRTPFGGDVTGTAGATVVDRLDVEQGNVPAVAEVQRLDFGSDFSVAPDGAGEADVTLGPDVYKQGTPIQASDLPAQAMRKDTTGTVSPGVTHHYDGTLDAAAGTILPPRGTAAAPTTAGKFYFDTDGAGNGAGSFTIGDGARRLELRACWTESVSYSDTENAGGWTIAASAGGLAGNGGLLSFTGGDEFRTSLAIAADAVAINCVSDKDVANAVTVQWELRRLTGCSAASDGAVVGRGCTGTSAYTCNLTGTTATNEFACSQRGAVAFAAGDGWQFNSRITSGDYTTHDSPWRCSVMFCATEAL